MHREGTEALAPRGVDEIAAWDDEADVVVVGLGCAGTCAAIEAAEAGADVLALERSGGGGGTSAHSGGIIYLGGGTPIQKACGYEDSVGDMARFLDAACGPDVDAAKVQAYCEGSVDHYHWLVDHGLPFKGEFHPEHDREPPTDAGLIYSGGEDSWPFTEIARPVPRGHHPEHPDSAGGFIMQTLLTALDRTSASVRTGLRIDALVVDGSGAVVGCLGTEAGSEVAVRARRGVVLAAGGFIWNPAMVERHVPLAAHCSFPVGTDTDDGSGIRLGLGAGGRAVHLDALEVALPLNPPRDVAKGVLVNAAGERFVNEDAYNGRIGMEILLRQGEEAYLVMDQATYVVNAVGMQAKWVCETVAELEGEIGLPPGSLVATLARYNEGAERGDDPDFHKAPGLLVPLQPPIGAIDLRVAHSIYAPFTLGGLDTTPDGEVRAADGGGRGGGGGGGAGIVPGLYAAGRTTCGIAVRGYVSGISLGDGTFFGRRAGRAAAARSGGP